MAPEIKEENYLGGTKQNLLAWYNNKGYHALPSYVNSLHNAMLRSIALNETEQQKVGISTYNQPIKITQGQINAQTM